MTDPKIRRRRQCGPKTRTGCQTCKIRRVKCDEEKPCCRRCTSTGRKCDGYLQDHQPPSPGSDSSNSSSSLALIQSISNRIPGNRLERRGFQYFVTNTAPELSGFYSSGFWEKLILQASPAEASLRHAVIAIGTLHEEFSQKRLSNTTGMGGEVIQFAVNQYTKAIGHLRRSLASGKEAPLTALMSCVLFVCFDSLRGYYESAMVHLQSGLKIMRALHKRSKDEAHLIENIICPLFVRLGVQSILYIDTQEPRDRLAFVSSLTTMLPGKLAGPKVFTTLEEARNCMEEAADALFRMLYICDGSKPMSRQLAKAYSMHEKAMRQLRGWNTSFENFMNAKSASFTSKQIRGAALLKIHSVCINIIGGVVPSFDDPRALAHAVNTESNLGRFNGEFQTIINLSRSMINATEQDMRNGKTPLTFSTDLGLIAPLYYVGVKCKVNSMREEAMDLLKRCPRKEGMWDSVASERMVREFWEIEARHKELQQGGPDELSVPVPLNEVVDLIFHDGGTWEWKWKDIKSTSSWSTDSSRLGTPVAEGTIDDLTIFDGLTGLAGLYTLSYED